MARRAVWVFGVGAAAVVAGTAAAGIFALERAPGWIGTQVGSALGRETRIGALHIDWAWTPTIRLSDLAIANADWGEADHLLTAREIRLRLRLLPLLQGRLELPEVMVDRGALALERRPGGDSNWSFSGSPEAAAAAEPVEPEEREEVPTIGRLRITDGTMTLRDAERDLTLDGKVATATGDAEGRDRLDLSLKGRLAGVPLTVRLAGGSVLMLREGEEPYPVDLDVAFGDTRVTVEGEFRDPIAFEGADVQMALSGPNLAEVFPLLGIPAPPSPPYDVEGRLRRNGEVWQLHGMSGRIGDSDVAGDVAVDYGRSPPLLRAELVSHSLDFDDLAPLVGAPPGAGDEDTVSEAQRRQLERMEKEDKLFPDVPLDAERLHAMDMDVFLTSDRVVSPDFLPVNSLELRVRVEAGRLEADPLRFGVAGGTVQGSVALNARADLPSAAADLRFERVDLAAFFQGTRFFDTMGGEIQGRLSLLGSGRSLADVMRTADGDAALAMTGGAISGLLVEGAGLDLTEALILVVGPDAKIAIRCALARLDVKDGRATIGRAVMDTTDSALYFRGGSNLQDQTVILDIKAEAKDFSLLDVDAPVHLEGKIRDPDISIGKGAPIPFLELGEGEDVPCEPLIEEFLRPPER